MAALNANALASTIPRAALVPKGSPCVSRPLFGLPQMGVRGGKIRCTASQEKTTGLSAIASSSLLASALSMSGPALALVDERMSTEGTGLSLGLSNNLLGWILLGVFGLIWALFFVYTATLEEDEESGLSL